MEVLDVEEVSFFIEQGKTYQQISDILKERYPGIRGLSLRSLKRFCASNGLSTRASQESIELNVSSAVEEVGPTFGRKMMSGFLRQKHGGTFGEVRVGKALAAMTPHYHQRRRNDTAYLLNPIPYRADYFGHKLHVDQNEKLVMYGATHVVAIDGHSRFVVACKTMPIKNNEIIYQDIFRKSCIEYGMFHQVRVDGGKEFYLMLGMQEQFKDFRNRQDIVCFRQTQSKQNLPIERFWVEVNRRVNYPIKAALVLLDNSNRIDMENEVHKFCVSFVTVKVTEFGIGKVMLAWNEHVIPGRGKPSTLKERSNRLEPIVETDLPESSVAKQLYERLYNGRLRTDNRFGIDPLDGNENLQNMRSNHFNQQFITSVIFGECVNERPQLFQEAVIQFIHITEYLYRLM